MDVVEPVWIEGKECKKCGEVKDVQTEFRSSKLICLDCYNTNAREKYREKDESLKSTGLPAWLITQIAVSRQARKNPTSSKAAQERLDLLLKEREGLRKQRGVKERFRDNALIARLEKLQDKINLARRLVRAAKLREGLL